MSKNVQILDCTLRDGGRIIDCAFPDYEIRELIEKLANAKIDIIEVGFLRDWRNTDYHGNSTFFTDVDQIRPFINKPKGHAMYVAFVDFGMFDFQSLKPYNGTSIDGIRFGFTKKDYDENKNEIIRCSQIIKENGYLLFMQGVNSLNYTDKELLEIVELVNEIHPYSFGIVDTYGAMYIDDVDRIYGLIDHNLDSDICINFHSHNNYQLSFGFAQEVVKLSNGSRQIIIDGTLGGMGKVAGNLNIELIIDYLVRKLHYDYEVDDVLDMIDDYIYKYSLKYQWGYSTPAMMAGIYKSHPNNVIYLTEKFRLNAKDIGKILSMIEPQKRQRYDYENIEKLYIEYVDNTVDDYDAIQALKKIIGNKEVLVLVPGNSLNEYREEIDDYSKTKDCFMISVNFVADDKNSYAFFGNQKRYGQQKKKREGRKIIVSSNIRTDQDALVVNYQALINRGYKYFENSTIILLNLLKRIEVSQITLAGFDGFETHRKSNYTDDTFQNDRHIPEFEDLNAEIYEMLQSLISTLEGKCKISTITPSRFFK